jgi:hydrogenase maturation protein HypF
MNEIVGLKINITGIVQGVGFRPFVYTLANRLGLKGWVKNTSAGVTMEVDGQKQALDHFVSALSQEAPTLSKIVDIETSQKPIGNYSIFEIIKSEEISTAFQPLSPDIGTCQDCLQELFNPSDRRYRYPFINCTNCGPRFTIIDDIPYDRPKTTMASFSLCPDCSAEYHDPANRRFHAQPVACKVCGPKVWLESSSIQFDPETDPILETQRLLGEGNIVAIKGLGGFHLACDGANFPAVEKLRNRKLRVDKPFALMMPDVQTVENYCQVSSEEKTLLESPQRPIVILNRKPGCSLPLILAPGQETLGVMLPYTPLHHLLFSKAEGSSLIIPNILVMTSGNLSEEPIAFDNQEAVRRLSGLADAFLLHNRNIRTRCDDSVMRISDVDKNILPVRRSRGYVPTPIITQWELPPSLATGAEIKNTFCVTRGRYAFMSHHIGDMENYETLQSFEDGVNHLEKLFKIHPKLISCDLHPNYLATRYASKRALEIQIPLVMVQHHHAHIASCMAENNVTSDQTVIGVAFDGTGYGLDDAIWGGEFLLANYKKAARLGHLKYNPLPGGDAAIRNPARIALAFLWNAGIEWSHYLPPVQAISEGEKRALYFQLSTSINSPQTSSLGRLFDAVAALIGQRSKVNYEAQAAIELESIADPLEKGVYPWAYSENKNSEIIVDPTPLLKAVINDFVTNTPLPQISARFHNSVSEMVLDTVVAMRNSSGINLVALSGGVWQNALLLRTTLQRLRELDFHVLTHKLVPPNDGGIALGQAIIAFHQVNNI